MQKTRRNDPCPCGSGKKYKKCCLAESYSPPGREMSIKSSLVKDILAFARKNYPDTIDEAYEYFWDDFDPQEHLDANAPGLADINFWEWFVHDWRPEEDEEKTLIELYMEKSKGLPTDHKNILARMNDAVISLYEVQEVFPEEGLLLKDLLLGDEYNLREKAATESLRKWDVFATRLLRLDGNHIIAGGAYPYPVLTKEMTIDHLKKCFKSHRRDRPEDSMRDFLKRNGDLFNYFWCENIREPFRPTLVTTSGEPMIFSNAVFGIKERDGVIEGLKKMDELDEIEEGVFQWLDERKSDDLATVLGTVRIKDKSLRLECHSKERLERGKALLLDRLGDSIIHKVDTLQDPYQALKNKPETSQKSESGIPKELEQQLYSQYMRKHYENWLNEKLPALEGKTPLETVKKPWGKKKVAELLKSIENSEEHRKQRGEPYFDTSWLWERLGIEK